MFGGVLQCFQVAGVLMNRRDDVSAGLRLVACCCLAGGATVGYGGCTHLASMFVISTSAGCVPVGWYL